MYISILNKIKRFLYDKLKLCLTVSIILVSIFLTIYMIDYRFNFIDNLKCKILMSKLSDISEVTVPGDGYIYFTINEKEVGVYLDNANVAFYRLEEGNFIKSNSEEFVSISLSNPVKLAPNSRSNFLLYSIDNYVGDSKSVELKSSKVFCRYSEIEEGYLVEVHNTNFKKGNGLIYFDEEGNLSEKDVYRNYLNTKDEFFQLVLPSSFKIDSIVKSIVDYLDNL